MRAPLALISFLISQSVIEKKKKISFIRLYSLLILIFFFLIFIKSIICSYGVILLNPLVSHTKFTVF